MYAILADNTHTQPAADVYGYNVHRAQLRTEPERDQEEHEDARRSQSARTGLVLSVEYIAAQRVDFDTPPPDDFQRTSTIGSAGYLATVLADPRWDGLMSKSHQLTLLATQQRLAFCLLLSQRADVTHSFFATASDDAVIIDHVGCRMCEHHGLWRVLARDRTRVAAAQLVAKIEEDDNANSDSSWEYTSDSDG